MLLKVANYNEFSSPVLQIVNIIKFFLLMQEKVHYQETNKDKHGSDDLMSHACH